MLFHHISTTKPEEQTTMMINFIYGQVKLYCDPHPNYTVRIHNGAVILDSPTLSVSFTEKYFMINNQEVPYNSITEIKREPENGIAICYGYNGYNRTLISSLLPSLFPGNNFCLLIDKIKEKCQEGNMMTIFKIIPEIAKSIFQSPNPNTGDSTPISTIQQDLQETLTMEPRLQLEYWRNNPDKIKEMVEQAQETANIVPNEIELFKDLDITLRDKIFFNNSEKSYDPSVLLINGEDTCVGIFNIKKIMEDAQPKYFLVANKECIIYDDHSSSKYVLLFTTGGEASVKTNVSITLYETEKTTTHLCIDFGTSNTTAGCYLDGQYVSRISKQAPLNGLIQLDERNIVKFEYIDPEENMIAWSQLVPTLVYVHSCKDKENILYDFGYTALERIKADGYCPKATCFMEIKRWSTDLDTLEEIQDSDGNKATVKREEIIKKYLQFIIASAENQFKCKFERIHISTPVKLKSKILANYKEIVENLGYKLETDHPIDEAVSVMYNMIDSQIKNKNYENKETVQALVFDCGGGTSDLASCSYTIEEEDDIISLNLTTNYLNGDVNFGGNNITYRIMQYLKVIYAHYFRSGKQNQSPEKIEIDEIIKQDSNSIFSYIEGEIENADEIKVKERYDEIYSTLQAKYDEAEEIIPTKFALYLNKDADTYNKVKNNFYFLWKISEEMKKEFYKHSAIQRYQFTTKQNDERNDDLRINKVGEWKISYIEANSGDFTTVECPEVTLNKSDITTLLMGDIYYLVRKFLNNLYEKQELQNYRRIFLSGQSTKIDVFTDALKEFLPGKAIQGLAHKGDDSESCKLSCVYGSIMYLRAKVNANIEVTLENQTKKIPASVYIVKQTNDRTYMIDHNGNDWSQPAKRRQVTDSGTQITLEFENSNKDRIRPYVYKYSFEECKKTSSEEIANDSGGRIKAEEVDSLDMGKKYIYVYLNEKEWGFNIRPIWRDSAGGILTQDAHLCSFDGDLVQETFFNGKK